MASKDQYLWINVKIKARQLPLLNQLKAEFLGAILIQILMEVEVGQLEAKVVFCLLFKIIKSLNVNAQMDQTKLLLIDLAGFYFQEIILLVLKMTVTLNKTNIVANLDYISSNQHCLTNIWLVNNILKYKSLKFTRFKNELILYICI